MRLLLWVLAGLVLVGLVGWVGLRVPARPFSDALPASPPPRTVALPHDLPAPVERFNRAGLGEQVPVIDTALVTGRGTMRVNGVTLPVRFRFTHVAGQDYRHDIDVTVFGRRLFTVDEAYRDGRARMQLPVGTVEGPRIDQGANLALWAEAIWMPSVWVTDPRVSWAPVDDHTALLRVPYRAEVQTFVVRFDPDTGLVRLFESMRFKGEEAEDTTLWLNEARAWGEVDGWLVPTETTVTWLDDGTHWARLTSEQVRYGLALDEDLRPRRPVSDDPATVLLRT